ncbi:hypothetical protein HDU98_008238 [Podochytrium sp. JEL0797]|nr:hypothetical protein HDU98_008238 [Podochytrium sp. JEL0797]
MARRVRANLIAHKLLYENTPFGTPIREIENMKRVVHNLTMSLYPWFPTQFASIREMQKDGAGSGIVMTAGSAHFEYLVLSVLALRKAVKCTLPIQVFYAGPNDLPDHMVNALSAFRDVTAINLLDHFPQELRKFNRWSLKPFAILASTFRHVIFVDADVYFFRDPRTLLTESKLFRKHGQVFFSDRTFWFDWFRDPGLLKGSNIHDWFHRVNPHMSRVARGLRFPFRISQHEMESGVVVVDKGNAGVLHALLNYHVDEKLRPLWWNGGILMTKHGNGTTFMRFEHAAMDTERETRKWDIGTDEMPFCFTPKFPEKEVVALGLREKRMGEKYVHQFRVIKEVGWELYLEAMKRTKR